MPRKLKPVRSQQYRYLGHERLCLQSPNAFYSELWGVEEYARMMDNGCRLAQIAKGTETEEWIMLLPALRPKGDGGHTSDTRSFDIYKSVQYFYLNLEDLIVGEECILELNKKAD